MNSSTADGLCQNKTTTTRDGKELVSRTRQRGKRTNRQTTKTPNTTQLTGSGRSVFGHVFHVSNLRETLFAGDFGGTFALGGGIFVLATLGIGLVQTISETNGLETVIALVSGELQRLRSEDVLVRVGIEECGSLATKTERMREVTTREATTACNCSSVRETTERAWFVSFSVRFDMFVCHVLSAMPLRDPREARTQTNVHDRLCCY